MASKAARYPRCHGRRTRTDAALVPGRRRRSRVRKAASVIQISGIAPRLFVGAVHSRSSASCSAGEWALKQRIDGLAIPLQRLVTRRKLPDIATDLWHGAASLKSTSMTVGNGCIVGEITQGCNLRGTIVTIDQYGAERARARAGERHYVRDGTIEHPLDRPIWNALTTASRRWRKAAPGAALSSGRRSRSRSFYQPPRTREHRDDGRVSRSNYPIVSPKRPSVYSRGSFRIGDKPQDSEGAELSHISSGKT